MFSNLADKLSEAFKRLRSKGKLTEADVKVGMREIKLALLEADVNFKVVKAFVNKVSERAVGAEVMESLLPGQQIVKIVNEELTALMGGSNSKLNISPKPPTVVLMCGLQGSGKTTHTAKLAKMYKKQGKNPLLVACDIYRPAAIKQLQVVAEQVGVPVFERGTQNPAATAKEAIKHAVKYGYDMVFVDTAGRLHVDEELMAELKEVREAVEPTEILLVVDAMTGQDAVNVAESFNNLLDITGVILTKLDGDTRGGAALSVRHVTGKPIKFIGTGEKLDAIEPFHPDRMASRILGMGDVL
ncbi:MAG: signal recognition particle protein, partial [Clostridia bacterium]|nr:signal recognition particle protein [Clostridia bacterium]